MAASIGGQTFAALMTLEGAAAQSEELEEIVRAGVHGIGYRRQGRRPRRAAYESLRDFASASALASAKNQYRQLVGTVVSLEDGLGNSRQVLVRGVTLSRERRMLISVGGIAGGAFWLHALWEVDAL